MAAASVTRPVLDAQHAAGFRLTIDDFGSGYSSLSSLQGVPVDRLKIDRAFFGDSAAGDSDAVARGIVDLVRRLNMEVVAEGIERASQLTQLAALQCDYGQGFLFGRPVTPASVEQMVWANRHGMHLQQEVAAR